MRENLLFHEKYEHFGTEVYVAKKLKGKHREHCLCWNCINFRPGVPEKNCPIANLVYAVDINCHIVTPVYECPDFDFGHPMLPESEEEN